MAAQMQHMIRQNAQKMQDTLADLYDWCAPLPSVPIPRLFRCSRHRLCRPQCAPLTSHDDARPRRESDVVEKDAKLGGAGSGVARKGTVRTVSGGTRAAPVRGGAVNKPTTLASKSGADLVDTLSQVKQRHEEREKQIEAEEKERQERKDWKSGNMQDYYRKWDTFDEKDAKEEEEPAAPSAKKAPAKAAKVNQKLGPAGITAPQTDTAIPTPQVLPRGLAENISALDDPTLNGGAREKDKGNSLYQDKRFGEAVAAYTRGLDVLYGKAAAECEATDQLQALKATLYCNRAMAHLKLENWELADADASSSLDLDPQMVKAYLRRGAARREQHRYADAVQDFERVLQIDPSNKDGIKQLGKAVQLLSKFGKAAKRGARAGGAGGPARGFLDSGGSTKGGKGKGGKGKGGKDKGLALAFEKPSKARARAEEKPWRVKIPVREVDGLSSSTLAAEEAEPEPAVAMGPTLRPPAGAKPMTPRAPAAAGVGTGAAGGVAAAAVARATMATGAGTPRTGYELERSLKALKSTPGRLLTWLLGLPAATVPALMKSILTAETLLAIVEPLSRFEEQEQSGLEGEEEGFAPTEDTGKQILTLLGGIANTPRFGMTVQFLAASEQFLVNSLFERLEARGRETENWGQKELTALAKAKKDYRVPDVA
jgi:tetratricopeptide (TPR) repeat protein